MSMKQHKQVIERCSERHNDQLPFPFSVFYRP